MLPAYYQVLPGSQYVATRSYQPLVGGYQGLLPGGLVYQATPATEATGHYQTMWFFPDATNSHEPQLLLSDIRHPHRGVFADHEPIRCIKSPASSASISSRLGLSYDSPASRLFPDLLT
jgi:hypothetical protein